MCGIVGYIGNMNAARILLDGLHRLEYRGYDSAGMALVNDGNLNVYSAITDRVLPEIKEWKSHTLEPVYAICWIDAIHYPNTAVQLCIVHQILLLLLGIPVSVVS